MGIAAYPGDARTPEVLIAQVDAALYRAKIGGRNMISTCAKHKIGEGADIR